MLRAAKDGSERSLLVYNFEDHEVNVVLDLSASDVALDQVPEDWYAGTKASPITGAAHSLTLPKYGFAMLGVD
jgi:hypothetical protein